MTTNDHDTQITAALGGLAAEAPSSLMSKVFARWISAPSSLGDVFVAFTGAGVQFLRPAGDADSIDRTDAIAEFAKAYRDRFARPLMPAQNPPAGLLPALGGSPARALEFDLSPLTDFERAVLAATRGIPAGQARPYSWVAREAGNPGAVRAAGSVLARNPVPLLVPCHRVVRADGGLGQYIFGSAQKEQLLREEGVNVDQVADLANHGVHYLGSDTTNIVCFPTCRDARRITPQHRHEFGTLAQAFEAGYRPCRHCRPAVGAA
jgi:O-6-methylguanine DNA methyltransferase